MKKLTALAILAMLLGLASCASYQPVTKLDGDKVVLVKNDMLLFGLIFGPKVYVCRATPKGLVDCKDEPTPKY